MNTLAQGFLDPPRDQRRELLGVLGPDVFEQDRELVPADSSHGVSGPERLRDPRRRQDEKPIPDGVAEAVIDQLETVDVQEQHGEGEGRVSLIVPQGMLEAVHEQGPVGEFRERIVEGVMPELALRSPALGDVRQRACHPRWPSVRGVTHGQAPGQDPSPRAVGMAHAVLGLHV